jgi:hypothetical protein
MKRTANKSVETNRRPAPPFEAGRQFGSALCAPALLSAAVAHLWRWPSQTDQESRQMKATGHGYVGCEVHVVGFPPRPDDNDHRCGGGSVLASSAFLAARSISLGGQPDGPANGRQPARRVAMRTPPVAGSRR